MTSQIKVLWMALIAVAIMSIGGYFYPQVKGAFGAIGSATNFYSLVTDSTITSGGNVTVTTSNTATSTVTVGCIQTYATSTVTPVHLVLSTGAGVSSAATSTFGTGTMIGLGGFAYGACPV